MVAHARITDAQYSLLPSTPAPNRKNLRPVDIQLVPPLVLPEPSDALRDLRASLDPRIAARLRSGSELVRSIARERRSEILPTAIDAIDALLDGGLARGKMTEIAGRGARWSIVLAALASATSIGEAAALIDLGDHFDPQLAADAGVDLRRVLWVRPQTLKQAVTAAEMIGATGFQLVVLDAGLPRRGAGLRPPERVETRSTRGVETRSTRRVPDAAWVRLARMAETHGCTLLVSAPYALTGTTSEAMLFAQRSRARWLGRGKAPRLLAGVEVRVRLEKHRRKRPGESAVVFFETICRGTPRNSEQPEELVGRRAAP